MTRFYDGGHRVSHDFTDMDDAIRDAFAEHERMEHINATIRRLEASHGSLGRISDRPGRVILGDDEPKFRTFLVSFLLGFVAWAALIWWQADNIAGFIVRVLT